MNPAMKHITLIAVTVALTVPSLAAAPPQRSFSAGHFGLELEGTFVGYVTKAEGGNIFSEVVKEESGEEYYVKKHVASPTPRDIVLEFGAGMDPALYNWIKGALQRQYLPKNGALLTIDFRGDIRSRLEFEQAQITQVTFPELDGSSKNQLRFSIRLTPLSTHLNPKTGGTLSTKLQQTKQLLTSNFRLAIDGLSMNTTSTVDALIVNLPRLVDPASVCVECNPTPVGPIDFPNLIVTISASQADSVYEWLEKFVIQGDNSDESEKEGTLDYLSPNFQSSLFQLAFKQLGIFEVAPLSSSNTDTIARVVVSMYCERIEFNFF
jgi:hypothetical protein